MMEDQEDKLGTLTDMNKALRSKINENASQLKDVVDKVRGQESINQKLETTLNVVKAKSFAPQPHHAFY